MQLFHVHNNKSFNFCGCAVNRKNCAGLSWELNPKLLIFIILREVIAVVFGLKIKILATIYIESFVEY